MKNKKILIIIIPIIVLLLIGIGLCAFAYFATDMFKSPKQLFFKYAGKTLDTSEKFDYDKFLENYKIQSEKSYKSSGEITATVNSDDSDLKQAKEVLDNAKITFVANSIPTKEKHYINIGITYKNNEITKFEGLASNNNYGLKCADLYDKYIYVENNNLKSLARKFGISATYVPDKLEKTNLYELLNVNKETRTKIKDTYYNVLDQKLDSKMFSKEKNAEITVNGEKVKTNAYSLKLNEVEAYDILISLLQTLKDDDTTLDLIIDKAEKSNLKYMIEQSLSSTNYSSDSISSTLNTTTVTFNKDYLKNSIQSMIDYLQNSKSDASSDNTMKITIYVNNKKPIKIELFANDESKFNLDITKDNNNNLLSFGVEGKTVFKADYTVNKGKNSQKLNGTITIIADGTNIPINFNIESNKELNKINLKTTLPIDNTMLISRASFGNDATFEIDSQTTGELGKGTNSNTSVISITSGDTTIKVNLKEDITFSDDVSIDDLNTDNGKCLNDMSVSEMETLTKEIIVNFQKVLPIKLQLLGVNTSTSNDNSLVVDTTDENSNNSNNETLVNTTTENSVLSTQED